MWCCTYKNIYIDRKTRFEWSNWSHQYKINYFKRPFRLHYCTLLDEGSKQRSSYNVGFDTISQLEHCVVVFDMLCIFSQLIDTPVSITFYTDPLQLWHIADPLWLFLPLIPLNEYRWSDHSGRIQPLWKIEATLNYTTILYSYA